MKTKVKKDNKGLYIICDGWVGRPETNTKFDVLDNVRATHPAGSTIYVRKNIGELPECWETIGTYEDYKNGKL